MLKTASAYKCHMLNPNIVYNTAYFPLCAMAVGVIVFTCLYISVDYGYCHYYPIFYLFYS